MPRPEKPDQERGDAKRQTHDHTKRAKDDKIGEGTAKHGVDGVIRTPFEDRNGGCEGLHKRDGKGIRVHEHGSGGGKVSAQN